MDFIEMGFENGRWTELTQECDQWRGLILTKLHIPVRCHSVNNVEGTEYAFHVRGRYLDCNWEEYRKNGFSRSVMSILSTSYPYDSRNMQPQHVGSST